MDDVADVRLVDALEKGNVPSAIAFKGSREGWRSLTMPKATGSSTECQISRGVARTARQCMRRTRGADDVNALAGLDQRRTAKVLAELGLLTSLPRQLCTRPCAHRLAERAAAEPLVIRLGSDLLRAEVVCDGRASRLGPGVDDARDWLLDIGAVGGLDDRRSALHRQDEGGEVGKPILIGLGVRRSVADLRTGEEGLSAAHRSDLASLRYAPRKTGSSG
jgi:hypothetical protein